MPKTAASFLTCFQSSGLVTAVTEAQALRNAPFTPSAQLPCHQSSTAVTAVCEFDRS
jgi:hypothetical protein